MSAVVTTFEKFKTAAQDYIRKHLRTAVKIRHRLTIREEVANLLLAVVVGIVGGLANLAFHRSEEFFKTIIFNQHNEISEIANSLPWWQRLITPALGGLAAGLVLYFAIKLTKKGTVSNFLEAVVAGDGRLPFRAGLLRTLSSLISFSSGASIGREGSIVHLSTTVASKIGQLFEFHPYKLRLLIACGSAAGIAAAFNAPLTGAVFAAQIVIGNFSMNLFAPIIVASVMAAVTSRSFFGIAPLYNVPPFDFTHLWQLLWLAFVGVGSGFLSVIFLKGINLSEKVLKNLIKQTHIRVAFGGLLVGAISILYPWVWGNGYGPTNGILNGKFSVEILLGLFIAKTLATTISVGSGTVGGVMTPSLFIGAAYGSFCGLGLHALNLAQELPVCIFALTGMGSVFAATTHSPLLAMLMVFEISLNYSLMPALMLTCPIATLISRHFHRDSVYTKPLSERGITVVERKQFGAAQLQTVADIMRKPVPPLLDTTPFEAIIERFLSSANNFLPVVDANYRLVGIVALQDIKEYLSRHESILGIIAYDVMRPVPYYLTPQQNLVEAFPVLMNSEMRNIPVVNNSKEMKLIGSVLRSEALGILSEAITAAPYLSKG